MDVKFFTVCLFSCVLCNDIEFFHLGSHRKLKFPKIQFKIMFIPDGMELITALYFHLNTPYGFQEINISRVGNHLKWFCKVIEFTSVKDNSQ